MIRAAWARLRRWWAFALAASSFPLSTLLQPPCSGAGCGLCPTSGGCVLLLPAILIFVAVAAQSRSRITNRGNAFPLPLNQRAPTNTDDPTRGLHDSSD
jgi:hypothetical protein